MNTPDKDGWEQLETFGRKIKLSTLREWMDAIGKPLLILLEHKYDEKWEDGVLQDLNIDFQRPEETTVEVDGPFYGNMKSIRRVYYWPFEKYEDAPKAENYNKVW